MGNFTARLIYGNKIQQNFWNTFFGKSLTLISGIQIHTKSENLQKIVAKVSIFVQNFYHNFPEFYR